MKLNPTNISIVKRLLVGRNSRPLRSILKRVEPADLASLLTRLPKTEANRLVDALISIKKAGDVLEQLPEKQMGEILESIPEERLGRIIRDCSTATGSDLLRNIDPNWHDLVLCDVPEDHKSKLLQFLNYPEDSAGRIMNSHFFAMPDHLTASEGLAFLQNKAREESIYYIYCIDENSRLSGVVSLRDLAISMGDRPLKEFAKTEVVKVSPETPSETVAQMVGHYDFIALPVVNPQNQIVGIITVDDVLDIIEDQATADIYASAGLQESDRVYSTIVDKIRNRTPWMFLNLILAGLASSVLYQFEGVLDELVLLAITKNIVTSTGGNTAIQSLTVITRGLALDDFQYITYRKALLREIVVGVTMGLMTGLAAGLILWIWKSNLDYGLVVGAVMFLSMSLTSTVAAACGASVPLLLKKLGRDPAVGSGVVVTVFTDIFGFFSFLGLATLALSFFGLMDSIN